MCTWQKLSDDHRIDDVVTDRLIDVDALVKGHVRSVRLCAHGYHWELFYHPKQNRIVRYVMREGGGRCPDKILESLPTYDGPTFASFVQSKQPSPYKAAIAYATGFHGGTRQDLIFTGCTGTGKSHLAQSIRHALAAKAVRVEWITAAGLSRLFCEVESWNDDWESRAASRELRVRLANCDLLIVDDLGAERTTKTEMFQQAWLEFWDERNQRKSWLITTNLDLTSVRARYGDKIYSRLTQYSDLVQFTGTDYRQTAGVAAQARLVQ